MPDFNNSISKAMMAVDLTSESVTEISLSDKTRAIEFETIKKFFLHFLKRSFFRKKSKLQRSFQTVENTNMEMLHKDWIASAANPLGNAYSPEKRLLKVSKDSLEEKTFFEMFLFSADSLEKAGASSFSDPGTDFFPPGSSRSASG